MERIAIRNRREPPTPLLSERTWRIGSVLVGGVAVVLSIATFSLHQVALGQGLLGVGLLMFCLVVALHVRFLHVAQQQYQQANRVLQATEREFQSLFENALDTILILDDQATCMDANPSALQLLGVRREELIGHSMARLYQNQREFQSSWEVLLRDRSNRGQSELLRGDSALIFVEFTAVASFLPGRHMMILRDVTQRRRAEEAMERSLVLARSARQEADAQRLATLALTQDLRMNYVLDTLLQTLHQLVPYEAAQVLLLETDTKLFLAREAFSGDTGQLLECPRTLDTSDYPILQKALGGPVGTLVPDTRDLSEWRPINQGVAVRSWLGVALLSSNQVLGVLSLSHTSPGRFSREHLRIAASLSIPAAVAIQNARLYERAEIYGNELERRLSDLHRAEQALDHSEQCLKTSEERFQKLFRWTPIAFSVTTLAEGRFIDVNEAFEHRYGYTRAELIGRTSTGVGLWEHPEERTRFVEELRHGARVRGAVTRLTTKFGESKVSLYSAETIQLDGQICVLAVFDDLR
jgi:PAS domain S-box-containing protein